MCEETEDQMVMVDNYLMLDENEQNLSKERSRLWEVPAGDSGSGAWPDRAAAQSYSRGRGQSTTTSPLFPQTPPTRGS